VFGGVGEVVREVEGGTVHINTAIAIYESWKDGHETPIAAIRALCMQLGEVESELDASTQEREELRNYISDIVSRLDGPITIRGIGKLLIRAPSITKGYDKTAIKTLIERWSVEFPERAEELAACEKQTSRSGALVIEWEK
jgi:hypothetical protein